MNIPISKEHSQRLENAANEKFVYGSRLFGVQNKNSDIDVLCIYEYKDVFNQKTFYPNIHSFQFENEETNTDTIYMTREQFWLNLFNGDGNIVSDIVLFSDKFHDTLKYCRTYKIIKAYCGVAKRDLTNWDKSLKSLYKSKKNLYVAKCLIDNIKPEILKIREIYAEKYNESDYLEIRTNILIEENTIRKEANELFNQNKLPLCYVEQTNDDLLNILINANNLTEFKFK